MKKGLVIVQAVAMLLGVWQGWVHADSSLKTQSLEGSMQTPLSKVLTEQPNWQHFSGLDKAGFVLLDANQTLLQAKNGQTFYVPASTTKLITALLAIEHWGLQHRFKTEFYLRQQAGQKPILVVKGFGDPFLVSEELQMIASHLKSELAQLGVNEISSIQLDVAYYQPDLIMPGTSQSSNPYDAIPSAVAANFNTINVIKSGSVMKSAEEQTPLVTTGKQIVENSNEYQKIKNGKKLRINLGANVERTQRYFAELLQAFLQQEGIKVGNEVVWQSVTEQDTLLYRHLNSRSLADVIKPMMKYSTNFIANQLALNLSVEVLGGQASKNKVQKAYQQLLNRRFDWQDFYIEDGAGLSRNNRLSPVQLIDVLHAFKPWRHLLPEIEQRVFAKSGSLIGVSTLAGYLEKDQELWPFAMMINQKVPYRFRNKLAKELAKSY